MYYKMNIFSDLYVMLAIEQVRFGKQLRKFFLQFFLTAYGMRYHNKFLLHTHTLNSPVYVLEQFSDVL